MEGSLWRNAREFAALLPKYFRQYSGQARPTFRPVTTGSIVSWQFNLTGNDKLCVFPVLASVRPLALDRRAALDVAGRQYQSTINARKAFQAA
jgi:hypothetical protein